VVAFLLFGKSITVKKVVITPYDCSYQKQLQNSDF